MNEVKVSVIIYVKNTVDYIEQCIRSVMNQTLKELEILVVDGGSTDGTLQLIERLKKEDARIRSYEEHGSVGAQFNLGLSKANGQYIGVCEADDYILPDMYKKQYEIAAKHRIDVLRAGYYQVCQAGGREYRFPVKACSRDELTGKVIDYSQSTEFLEQGINGFWSGLYRRTFLLSHHIQMNETKGAAYQDISFSFLTQMLAERVWFMGEAFYCYRIDNPNASVNSIHGVRLHRKEYAELKKKLLANGWWESYKNLFFSWELVSYRWFLRELPKSVRKENAEAVYRYLRGQMEESGYDKNTVIEGVEELADSLDQGMEPFIHKIFDGMGQSDELLFYLEGSFRKEARVVLFGVGHLGMIAKQFLELCKKEVVLTDNSRGLQKSGFMGERVFSPEKAAEYYPDEPYLIANTFHGQEMKEQLQKLGIPDKNIFLCSNEEFFLRKIFVSYEEDGRDNKYER